MNNIFKTYNVIFEDYKGKRHKIATVKDKGNVAQNGLENCFKSMYNYLQKNKPNFTIYYTRLIGPNSKGNFCVDFGSHVEFIYFEEIKKGTLNEETE